MQIIQSSFLLLHASQSTFCKSPFYPSPTFQLAQDFVSLFSRAHFQLAKYNYAIFMSSQSMDALPFSSCRFAILTTLFPMEKLP
ncbi:hypothetical protein GOP47_0000507 [Adiantum capillus-veneris]|uniref:Uncharacterized protein n=1 Tax=Adiantum capillus-veneris TaxID=13818 RepID=A0A9D4ZQS6_ADICA|nr:hypothetical protein GOP47_0000507 [Adiantum capillus-veneris]